MAVLIGNKLITENILLLIYGNHFEDIYKLQEIVFFSSDTETSNMVFLTYPIVHLSVFRLS